MKILYYSPNPYLNLEAPTGYGTHMREIIYAFREMGHTVYPLIMGGTHLEEGITAEAQKASILKQTVKAVTPPFLWSSLRSCHLLKLDKGYESILRQKIEEFQPDLVYERAGYLQTSGMNVIQPMNIPHLVEINAPFTEEQAHLSGKSLYIGKSIKVDKTHVTASSHTLTVSSVLKEHLLEISGVNSSKISVIPNAINPSAIKITEEFNQAWKKLHGLEHEIIIGFVGSIFPWHGVDLLIKAFSRVLKENSALHLLIVGDGGIMGELVEMVREMGIEKKVTFEGKVPNSIVYNYINLMDITVMAKSNWYGSPVKIFEYGALGKAVIAPDNGPVRDVMTHGEHGLLVDTHVEAIAQAMREFIQSKNLRNSLGENWQKKILAQHSWKRNAEVSLAKHFEKA